MEETLRGWGAELYTGQKFWWMDWNRLVLDVLTALAVANPLVSMTTAKAMSDLSGVQQLKVEPRIRNTWQRLSSKGVASASVMGPVAST